jgi:Tol biopolymer transport system component
VVVAAASLAFALRNRPPATQKTAARFTIPLSLGQEITSYPAITRDGRTVAYVAQQGTDDAQLYLRDLNSFEARPVPGASGARQPFFSPDGKWVAYFARGLLQKAEVTGGAPIRLAEAPFPHGGTWNEDNTIIYSPSLGSGLWRVPATGVMPESLKKLTGRPWATPMFFRKRFRVDEVFFLRFGGKRAGTHSSRWTPTDRRWSCPRRRLPPGFSTPRAVRRAASWLSIRAPA